MPDLLQEIVIERDELRAQVEAIRRVMRQYRMMQGRESMRRRSSYMDPLPLRGVFRLPQYSMMNGPLTAEEVVQEVREILRRS